MLIISVMGVTNIIIKATFQHVCRNDFDDELKISFLISSSVTRSKEFILDIISVFCTDVILCTLSRNLEWIIAILSTKCLGKCMVLVCGRTC